MALNVLRGVCHQILEMIKDIREVFLSNLEDLTWMDEQTRRAAEEKVRRLKVAVACLRFAIRFPTSRKTNSETTKMPFVFFRPELFGKESATLTTS